MPLVDWDKVDLTQIVKRNPDYTPPEELSNSEWLLELYKNMLKMDITEQDQGHKYWMNDFAAGNRNREGIKA